MMRRALLPATLVAALAAACDGPSQITFPDNGVVLGLAYVDRNGDGALSATDGPAAGIAVRLLLQATGDTIARAASGEDGTFRITQIPAGRYRLVALRGTVGDSLDVLQVDDGAEISIAANDSLVRLIRVGYPRVSLTDARQLPPGTRITVAGIALNGWSTFADSTIHLADGTSFLRVRRVAPSGVQAGDSIALIGTTGAADDHFVLTDGLAHVLIADHGLPVADSLSTEAAASADDDRLRDGQARIAAAVVLDVVTIGPYRQVGVDDGSGRVDVLLRLDIPFPAEAYTPGARVAMAGVLTPAAAGMAWRLRPRSALDVVAAFSPSTVAQARALAAGELAVLEGRALNGRAAFADSTVHVRDATGALRAVRVAGNVAAGDSIRIMGFMSTRNGQPVLNNATATVLLAGVGLPAPDSISALLAAGAGNGTLDAELVRAAGTITSDQLLPDGDRILVINDGSGSLEVLLDGDITFNTSAFQPGAILNATGVLVPTGGGSWQLKPRSGADAQATYPSVTIAQARALEPGRVVYIRGVALNSWVTFGDASVHMRDPSGTMRVVQLPQATVFAGDSIRILGAAAVVRGQPVLDGASTSVLLTGVGTGTPDSVTTLVASNADSGARDAGQVAVSGTISAAVTETPSNDVLLTVTDGSGPLTVRLDIDVGFTAGMYTIGDAVRVRGVLVPGATGLAWELKPRMLGEIAKTN